MNNSSALRMVHDFINYRDLDSKQQEQYTTYLSSKSWNKPKNGG